MKKKASEIALDYIKEKILTREWIPGDKISSEKQLEEEIGVSRSSVRSAVEKLVALSMLDKRPGDGTYVNQISSESTLNTLIPLIEFSDSSYYEILQCRMQLDILAIELFMDNMSIEDILELERLNNKMIEAIGNVNRFIDLDVEFHRVIAKGSGNKTLQLISDILFSILKKFSSEEYSCIPTEKKCEHHDKFFKAIKSGNKQLAIAYERASFLESMALLKSK